MEEEPKLYTVAQVAQMLGVSGMTVYRLVNSGKLSAARFGNSMRITRRALFEFLEQSPMPHADPAAALDGILSDKMFEARFGEK